MEPKVFDPSLMENRFRHEFKYECSYAQLKNLQCRLSGLIPLDPHAGEDGIYNIRSLYFDDYYDRCLMENEAGTDPREKFRIRIYNHAGRKHPGRLPGGSLPGRPDSLKADHAGGASHPGSEI